MEMKCRFLEQPFFKEVKSKRTRSSHSLIVLQSQTTTLDHSVLSFFSTIVVFIHHQSSMFRKLRGALGIERQRAMAKSSALSSSSGGPGASAPACYSFVSSDNPVELGHVRFLREFDEAIAISKDTGKPVFMLFQEVPGCQTCSSFGRNVLSDPLMVEAIETQFVPLSINNRCIIGHDRTICSRFNEPALNNPVVRFINGHDFKDLIRRKDGVYTAHEMLQRMIQALEAANRDVPPFVTHLLMQEKVPKVLSPLASATFTMGCYWQGERVLGGIEGVHSTCSGWINATEVVLVTFDTSVLSFAELFKIARNAGFGVLTHNKEQADEAQKHSTSVSVGSRGPLSLFRNVRSTERKYYLKQTLLRHIPLLPIQSARLNSLVASGMTVSDESKQIALWLSPRQLNLLRCVIVSRSTTSASKNADLPTAPDDPREHQHHLMQLKAVLE